MTNKETKDIEKEEKNYKECRFCNYKGLLSAKKCEVCGADVLDWFISPSDKTWEENYSVEYDKWGGKTTMHATFISKKEQERERIHFDTKQTAFFLDVLNSELTSATIKAKEEVFNKLISSMPSDAENLSTLTEDQALKTIRTFMGKQPFNLEEPKS